MSSLYHETLHLVRLSNMSVEDICKAAQVKPRWLAKFKAGDFTDPGVNKIERLNRVLKQQQDRAA